MPCYVTVACWQHCGGGQDMARSETSDFVVLLWVIWTVIIGTEPETFGRFENKNKRAEIFITSRVPSSRLV